MQQGKGGGVQSRKRQEESKEEMRVTYGRGVGGHFRPRPGRLALGGGALPLISGPQSPVSTASKKTKNRKTKQNKNRSLVLSSRLELFRPVNGQSRRDTG